MRQRAKIGLAALMAGVVVMGVGYLASHHNRSHEISSALKLAGFEEDDAGRIILTPNESGLALAYDPNLHDPTTGFRSAMAAVDSCLMSQKTVDECVQDARRCVSSTPWKDDPAGDYCFPESCANEYRELRKTKSEDGALMGMVRGTCYPGMKDLLSGRWKP